MSEEMRSEILERHAMLDLTNCKSISLEVDRTGKLWVNVDGKCAVRVGKAENVSIDIDSGEQQFDIISDGVLNHIDTEGG